MRLSLFFVLIFGGTAGVLAGCSKAENVQTIREIRKVPAEERLAPSPMDTAKRMGLSKMPEKSGDNVHLSAAMPPMGNAMPNAMPPMGSTPGESIPFTWELPADWKPGPEKPMRLVTFVTGPEDQVECYLTQLSGEGGGIDANLNRWRGQLGLPALSPEETAALPRWPVLGRDAVYMEGSGDYTNMTGSVLKNAMLLGVVCPLEGKMLFIRMTGPQEEVAARRGAFESFCRSLRVREN